MLLGQHTSEVLMSAIAVQVRDRVPSDSKNTGDTDVVGVMVAPRNGQVGVRPSLSPKVVQYIDQLKNICANSCSTGYKQEELETVVQQENLDVVTITETRWADSHS